MLVDPAGTGHPGAAARRNVEPGDIALKFDAIAQEDGDAALLLRTAFKTCPERFCCLSSWVRPLFQPLGFKRTLVFNLANCCNCEREKNCGIAFFGPGRAA